MLILWLSHKHIYANLILASLFKCKIFIYTIKWWFTFYTPFFPIFYRRGWIIWKMEKMSSDCAWDYAHLCIPSMSALEIFLLNMIGTLFVLVRLGDLNFWRYSSKFFSTNLVSIFASLTFILMLSLCFFCGTHVLLPNSLQITLIS